MIVAFACVTLMAASCIEIERQVTDVDPGTVPPEIQGARWRDLPVTFCIVRDEEGGFVDHDIFVGLTQRAAAEWGIPTQYEGECDGPMENGNGRNEIGWGTLGGDAEALTEAGNTHIRYRTTLGGNGPEIVEADITIERDPASRHSSEDCLYTTLLHEAGHLFGVPHLSGSSVMSPVITDCLQELTPEDRAFIEDLY